MDPANPFTDKEKAALEKVLDLAVVGANDLESEFGYPAGMVQENKKAIEIVKAMIPSLASNTRPT